MNIAIIGYGKMGKEIESLSRLNFNIVSIIDLHNKEEINTLKDKNVDVAIEFTAPDSAIDNIISCFKQQIPIVCGTTGWYDKINYIKQKCNEYNGALIYSPNFSIGVNIYFNIVKQTSKILKKYIDNYKVTIEEIHHTQKKDSPSGTAINLANIICGEINNFNGWQNFLNNLPENIEFHLIPIVSRRIENVVGVHKVVFSSIFDDITLEHKAKNRKGFALGALMAAEFIKDKKGIYTMNDLLNENI